MPHSLRLWGSLSFTLACFTATGCKPEDPTGCRISLSADLPASPLSQMANVRLDRAGDGFVMIGADAKGDIVRFARVSEAGAIVGAEATMTVPPRVLGPFYGVTGKASPGDQLVVVIGVEKAGAAGQIELQAITLDVGAAVPAAPRPLRDAAGKDLIPAGVDLKDVRAAMGSSKTGLRAAFAWGFAGQKVAPRIVVLKPDGELQGPPVEPQIRSATTGMTPDWECLAIVPSRTDFALSLVGKPQQMLDRDSWFLVELKDAGTISYNLNLMLNYPVQRCPVVTPTAKGYGIVWQNNDGTFYGDVDLNQAGPTIPVIVDILKGAVRFGGPDKQPPVACLASMEKEYAVTYESVRGPQVDRYNVFGNPNGKSLFLPVQGTVGPMSGWPVPGAMFATYLDQPAAMTGSVDAGAGESGTRRFVKVTCPAEL